MVDSGVDIVGDGVVVDLGDNVDGGEGESDGDGVGDGVGDDEGDSTGDKVGGDVGDIVDDGIDVDELSLFPKSVASN